MSTSSLCLWTTTFNNTTLGQCPPAVCVYGQQHSTTQFWGNVHQQSVSMQQQHSTTQLSGNVHQQSVSVDNNIKQHNSRAMSTSSLCLWTTTFNNTILGKCPPAVCVYATTTFNNTTLGQCPPAVCVCRQQH